MKMLCGGEALPRELADRLLALPGELWNLYGPTETTVWSTLTRVRDTSRPISIGRPIAETSIHVLEASGLPAPLGVAGELCIGGVGVARGYRNRPELTAEKFVTLDLGGAAPERVYRTGDLVRLRSDGQLEFVGRRDQQVKLRGFRIELEEIETALATCAGVRQNVVAVREDIPGDQRLVAYVVTADGQTLEADAVRTTLRSRLPEYMVPNLFVTLAALPLTPNGKVDRKALPPPQAATAADDGAADALMTPPQQRVAAIWRELLGAARVGLRANFFDLGGHSLLLVKLQLRLQREFGVELPLVELFQRTTVESQAERLTAKGSDDGPLRRARERAARQAHV
jgi:acyl-CoA synthetase (AMP-forming)/AMP-acid ligase II/acyl carrier protein